MSKVYRPIDNITNNMSGKVRGYHAFDTQRSVPREKILKIKAN